MNKKFPNEQKHKQCIWLGLEVVWQEIIEYIDSRAVVNGLAVYLAWKEKGWKIRDKEVWCKGCGLTCVKISASHAKTYQTASTKQAKWFRQVNGPSLIATQQVARWTHKQSGHMADEGPA